MKVKVSIELDIPASSYLNEKGEVDEYSLGCVHEHIFDNLINFALLKHIETSCEYISYLKNMSESELAICENHAVWSKLLTKARDTLKIEKV